MSSCGTPQREPGLPHLPIEALLEEEGQVPVIVVGELPQNTSASVTNMVEYLAPALIPRHFAHRFEEQSPANFFEHYVEERTAERRLGRKATWDRSVVLSLLGAAAGVALWSRATVVLGTTTGSIFANTRSKRYLANPR